MSCEQLSLLSGKEQQDTDSIQHLKDLFSFSHPEEKKNIQVLNSQLLVAIWHQLQYSPPISVNPVKNADVTVMVFSEKMCAPKRSH